MIGAIETGGLLFAVLTASVFAFAVDPFVIGPTVTAVGLWTYSKATPSPDPREIDPLFAEADEPDESTDETDGPTDHE